MPMTVDARAEGTKETCPESTFEVIDPDGAPSLRHRLGVKHLVQEVIAKGYVACNIPVVQAACLELLPATPHHASLHISRTWNKLHEHRTAANVSSNQGRPSSASPLMTCQPYVTPERSVKCKETRIHRTNMMNEFNNGIAWIL